MTNVPQRIGIPDWEFRVTFGSTRVDYDVNKEASNRVKHGYSLESAVQLLERVIFPFGNQTSVITSDG